MDGSPKDSSGTCVCYFIWQKKKGFVYVIKEFKMRLYPGLSRWALNVIICNLKRGRGRRSNTHRRRWCEDGAEWFEDANLEDWSNMATSQERPATIRSWKRQGMDSPLKPPEEPTPWFQHSDTDFRLLASRTVREYSYVVLSCPVCVNLLQQP